MCFTDKRKRNWIQKEDSVPDQVRSPGRVKYDDAGRHRFLSQSKVASKS